MASWCTFSLLWGSFDLFRIVQGLLWGFIWCIQDIWTTYSGCLFGSSFHLFRGCFNGLLLRVHFRIIWCFRDILIATGSSEFWCFLGGFIWFIQDIWIAYSEGSFEGLILSIQDVWMAYARNPSVKATIQTPLQQLQLQLEELKIESGNHYCHCTCLRFIIVIFSFVD